MDEPHLRESPREGEASTVGRWLLAFAVTCLSPAAAAAAALLLAVLARDDAAFAIYLAGGSWAAFFSGYGPTLVPGPFLPRAVAAVAFAAVGLAACIVLFSVGVLVLTAVGVC